MKLKQWFGLFRKDAKDEEVEQLLASQGLQPTPATDVAKQTRKGVIAVSVGLLGFFIWAVVAPLTQGVPVTGFVKVEGNRKTIQHLKGGIIEEILVREGDQVKEDQPLLRLNETQFKAQLGIIESQLIGESAVEARLVAERSDKLRIEFPAFLLERHDNPRVLEVMQTHEQLFATRRSALKSEQAIGMESIAGLEEQIRGLTAQEAAKAQQLSLYQEELTALKPLYAEGYIPRTRMFELERAVAYIGGQRSDDIANIGRARRQIAEIRQKILQSKDVYKREVETQLTETQSKVADLKERMVALQDDLTRVVLRSPAAGIVVDLAVHTVGGVVSPGQKLMDVVPEGEGLVVEVQIPTHLIDNVHSGLDADIHFTAFDQSLILTIPGKLVYVSADRLTDPKTDTPYYVGRVVVTKEGVEKLGRRSLQPGMPADVVIKTGERTMMGYLLKPLLKRLNFAFTER